jgi:hypothetical protein
MIYNRIIVAGSRSFNDMNLMIEKLDKILSSFNGEVEIVSGGAKGADLLGEAYAALKGHDLMVFEANWELHGKSAGYKRNEEMAKYATHCVTFWDGNSRGTRHMQNIAERTGLKTRIIQYSPTTEVI